MSTPSPADQDRLARRYGGRPPASGVVRNNLDPFETIDDDGARPATKRRVRDLWTRRRAWLGSAVIAVLGIGVVLALRLSAPAPVAQASLLSYEVASDSSTTVRVSVTRPDPTIAVMCAVDAVDASLAQVGAREIEIPSGAAGDSTVVLEAPIATFARAEQGRVIDNGCFAAP